MQDYLAIEIPLADADEVSESFTKQGIPLIKGISHGFDGSGIATIVVELTATIVPFLSALYAARVATRKHVHYKAKGMEIKGVSEETLLRILEDKTREK